MASGKQPLTCKQRINGRWRRLLAWLTKWRPRHPAAREFTLVPGSFSLASRGILERLSHIRVVADYDENFGHEQPFLWMEKYKVALLEQDPKRNMEKFNRR
jgi:hypothetical protein